MTPGRFQFESGYTFTKSGAEDEHDFGELLVRLGILPWLEGRLALNSSAILRDPGEERDGLEDTTIGFKAVLYRKPTESPVAVPQIAVLLAADLPTGSNGFGSSEVQPGMKLAVEWSLTERLGLASNVGWAYLSSDDKRYDQFVGSLSLGYAISGPLSAFGEWYALFPENRAGGSSHYLDGGLSWAAGSNVKLDWRLGAGLQDPDPNWFTGLGLSIRL